MPRAHRPSPGLGEHLAQLYDRFPFDRSLAQDPIECVRPYGGDRRTAEIAGLVAATLAIGNTTAIRGAFGEFERRVDHDPVRFVETTTATNWARRLEGFRHRWIRGDQVGYLALRLREVYRSYDSLESVFLEGYRPSGEFAEGLDRLSGALRGPTGGAAPHPPQGYAALFPTPLTPSHSACKRLTLYVRWMVRPRFPDLGVWTRVPTGALRVPLDQHVFWIAYHTGLTQRRTRSWPAVEEVSEALRRIDPIDPVKYDFVLCHTGISGDCPKERDLTVCGPCTLRPDCLLWRRARAA
ncbi:MAG: DUF2400 domain-containing protein [Thermoplasmata archaeon]|nr:DUF2400 domain-containing protein [Thermoplasmata archaeon]